MTPTYLTCHTCGKRKFSSEFADREQITTAKNGKQYHYTVKQKNCKDCQEEMYGWNSFLKRGEQMITEPMPAIEPKMFTTDYYFEQIEYYLSEKDCHHENVTVLSVMSNFK